MNETLSPALPLVVCRRCSQQQPLDYLYCNRCGASLANPRLDAARHAVPLWQLGLFLVLSCGLYLIPWCSRCYRFANDAWAANGNPKHRSPWRRALLLLVPFVSIWAFFRMVTDVREAGQIDTQPGSRIATLILFVGGVAGSALPGWYRLLVFVGLLACSLPLQHQINQVCEGVEPGVTARRRLGWRALAGVLAGVLLWSLLITGVLLTYRESTGVVALQFGHDFQRSTGTLVMPATSFTNSDSIAWVAHLNGRVGTTHLLRTFDRQTAGRLERVLANDITFTTPSIHTFYGVHPLSSLFQDGLSPGMYLLRYWRDGKVIAQGSFTIQR